MKIYHYYRNCVCWPQRDVFCEGGLVDMINNRLKIIRRTFLKHVDRGELAALESQLGYDSSMRMSDDWHVEYFRSTLHGRRVYGFRHSAIEYVFTQ